MLFRSREQREAEARYRQTLASLADGALAVETARDVLAQEAAATGLRDGKLRALRLDAYRRLTERLIADGHLSPAEEQEWERVGDALGFEDEEIVRDLPDLIRRLAVVMVNDGRLPVVEHPQLMTQLGEIVHAEVAAGLAKEVVDRRYVAGHRGVSIKIAPGVRYYAGGSRGRTETVGSHWETFDSGVLSITSIRVVYRGTRKTVECKYAKMVGIRVFADALEISVSNRQTPSMFTLEGPELPAAIITAAAGAVAS